MKAITAINAIIVLVLGVIALLAILGLFMGVWSPAKSGTSLQAATLATCAKVNPAFCKATGYPSPVNMEAARMPVYDFDANANGRLNDHTPEGNWQTSFMDDNLEALCNKYYGCINQMSNNLKWIVWTDCCLVKVCGCPKYY